MNEKLIEKLPPMFFTRPFDIGRLREIAHELLDGVDIEIVEGKLGEIEKSCQSNGDVARFFSRDLKTVEFNKHKLKPHDLINEHLFHNARAQTLSACLSGISLATIIPDEFAEAKRWVIEQASMCQKFYVSLITSRNLALKNMNATN